MVSKNTANACQSAPSKDSAVFNIRHESTNYPESVTTCSQLQLRVRYVDTYFKPKDDLPNPKGPCHCGFHCKRLL